MNALNHLRIFCLLFFVNPTMAVNHAAAIPNVAMVIHGVIVMQIAASMYLHLSLNEPNSHLMKIHHETSNSSTTCYSENGLLSIYSRWDSTFLDL
jgi:hypothetical protein